MTDNISQKFQERMPISLGNNFTIYRKNSQSTLFEYRAEVNSVVGRVGEAKGNPLIIFSANLDGALLKESIKHLNQSRNYDRLYGNIMIYQQPQQIYSIDTRDRTVHVEKVAQPGSTLEFWEQNRPMILMGAGMLALLILVSLLFQQIMSYRKRDKEPERSEKKFTPFK